MYYSPAEVNAIMATKDPKDIVARECKFATYSVGSDRQHDCLVSKVWLTYKDGTRVPTLVIKEDYERPIWINKPAHRQHSGKICFEFLENVDRFKCRQMDLPHLIYDKLKMGDPNKGLRKMFLYPYTYGGDQGPEVFFKQTYMNKWPDAFRPNTVTIVDAETDVFKPGYQPILWSEVNDQEIILYYDRSWTRNHLYYEEDVRKLYEESLPHYIETIKKKLGDAKKGTYPSWLDDLAKLPLKFVANDDYFGMTEDMINHLHNTQPDFVSGWNFQFDMKVMAGACVQAGRDPVKVLSDPRVPREFQMAYIKDGQTVKVAASGRELRLAPEEQWHISVLTASWRPQDAMQLYWNLRKAKGKESGGYSLEARASDQLGIGKMTFTDKDSDVPPGTLHWHMDMQRNYKIPYGTYAIFDSISVWAMNKKNGDLSSQISALAGSLDYSQFNSQPKINCASMLFDTLRDRKKVICTTSSEMVEDVDDETMSRDGWIVAFPAHNIAEPGLCLFHDMPTVVSRVYKHCSDADLETTYPVCEIIMNLDRETTVSEPCKIRGLGAEKQRKLSVNLTGGPVNAIEIMQMACKLPKLDAWVERIREKHYPHLPA